MFKRVTSLILTFILIFSVTACSKVKDAGGEGVILPVPKDGKAELTILISSKDYSDLSANGWLYKYIIKFKQDFGVDVKFEQIMTSDGIWSEDEEDAYLEKLFVKLTTKDGPELIYNRYVNMRQLIEQQALIDLRSKVPNLDKVYEGLISDRVYYVPLGVEYLGLLINRAILAELGVGEPVMNWASDDYYAIRNKWVLSNKQLFNNYEYYWAFDQFINLESLYNTEGNKVVLNTPEVRQKIADLRKYVFGGSFQLIAGYRYENYYNMLFEPDSEESKKDHEAWIDRDLSNNLDNGVTGNLLRASDVQQWVKEYAVIKHPRYASKSVDLGSYGFLVSKNGKHLDLAYEFINGLLSNEVQMEVFEGKNNYFLEYPVNKEIEADILKLEAEDGLDPRALQVKSFVLQELKDGKCELSSTANNDIYRLNSMLYKDITKLILADNPYSDEQLQAELKRMEDKYNIYLNE